MQGLVTSLLTQFLPAGAVDGFENCKDYLPLARSTKMYRVARPSLRRHVLQVLKYGSIMTIRHRGWHLACGLCMVLQDWLMFTPGVWGGCHFWHWVVGGACGVPKRDESRLGTHCCRLFCWGSPRGAGLAPSLPQPASCPPHWI